MQTLRGVAALMVVLYHVGFWIKERNLGSQFQFLVGAAGVDIFFAISGFVMMITATKLKGSPHGAGLFLVRRLIRVAPLYWLFTILKMTIASLFPEMFLHPDVGLWHTFASFFFIPAVKPETALIQPILTVGWTLSYEMFFYLLFAISLAFSRQIGVIVGLLLAGTGISFFRTPEWWAVTTLFSPLLWEFLFGIGVGWAVMRQRLLPVPVAFVGVPLALVMMVLAMQIWSQIDNAFIQDYWFRVVGWGMPAVLLLYALISLEGWLQSWLKGLPGVIGDASYSIYLSHGFVLSLVGAVWSHLHLIGPAWCYGFLATSLVASTVVGILVHWGIEMPTVHYLNQAIRQPDPVGFKAKGA